MISGEGGATVGTPWKSLSLERGSYRGWDTWQISSGPLNLVLVPQVGGRIMVQWQGRDLSFVHPDLAGRVLDPSTVRALSLEGMDPGFPLWGGDKTWIAPQGRWVDRVPFPDLDSGGYELRVDRSDGSEIVATMTSRVCRETGMQITRTLHVSAGGTAWTVRHRLLNTSSRPATWAPWDVTMLRRPGVIYLPRNPSSPFPQGVKTFADEGESAAVRASVVTFLDSLAVVRCDGARKFKFGVDASEGWMLVIIELDGLGLVGYGKRVVAYPGCEYAHGCLAEVFNSDRFPYFEMEIHGPLVTLGSGQAVELTEHQSLVAVQQRPASQHEVRRYVDEESRT